MKAIDFSNHDCEPGNCTPECEVETSRGALFAEIERLQAENKLLRESITQLPHQRTCAEEMWYRNKWLNFQVGDLPDCDCPKSKVPAK